MGNIDRIPVGKCSQCGGVVSLPRVWHSVMKPVPLCESCSSHVDTTSDMPTIKTVPPAVKKQTVDAFCSWCNRRMNGDGQPYGSKIPRYEQRGTHGVCTDCLEQGRVQS